MWFPGGPAGAGSVLTAAMAAGLTVIVQTTVILAMGFLSAILMKRQGPVAQAFVLRVMLVLAVLCPVLTLSITHERVIVLPVPGIVDAPAAEVPIRMAGDIPVYTPPRFSDIRAHEDAFGQIMVVRPAPVQTRSTVQHVEPVPAQTVEPPAVPASMPPFQPGILRPSADTGPLPMPPAEWYVDVLTAFVKAHLLHVLYAVFFLIWGMFSSYLAMRSFKEYLFLRWFRHHAEPVEPLIEEECARIARHIGVAAPVVRRAPRLVSPIITGIHRPMILMPMYLPGDGDHLTEIFLHELTHLKRHDQFWSYFRQALVVLLPIQPLVWLYARYLDEVADYVCDAVVTTHTHDRRSYATTLFAIASRYTTAGAATVPGIGFISFASPLRRRIERILNSAGKVPLKLSMRSMTIVSIVCITSAALSDAVCFEGRSMTVTFGEPPERSRMTGNAPVDLTWRRTEEDRDRSITPEDTLPEYQAAVPVVADPDASAGSSELFEHTADHGEMTVMAEAPAVRTRPRDMSAISGWDEAAIRPAESAGSHISLRNADNITDDAAQYEAVVVEGLEGGQDDADTVVQADAGPGGVLTEDDVDWFISSQAGMNMPSISETKVQVPTSFKVQVSVPEYQNGVFDLSDPDQLKQYNIYASLDKNKNEPSWSPDGSWIAFTDKNRIWMVPVTGGEPRLVYENYYLADGRRFPIGGIESITFTPDGRSLIFKLDRYDRERGSRITINKIDEIRTIAFFENPIPQIVRLDLETEETTCLVDGGYDCALSHDGQKLCYLIADLPQDTDDLTQLHHPVLLSLKTGYSQQLNNEIDMYFGKPAFTPDGESVILPARKGKNPVELIQLSHDGGQLIQLTTFDPDKGHGKYMEFPEVSPDGEWVMYTDFTISTGRPDKRLMLFSTISGERFEMFPDAIDRRSYGTWSPDGKSICYLASEPDGNMLYVCRFEPRMYKITVPEDVEEPNEPLVFSLGNPYPNPFNSTVSLPYTVSESGRVNIEIFNSMGQRVRVLLHNTHEPGAYTVCWDGCDEEGRSVSSGIYIAMLVLNDCWTTCKMTLTK